MKVLRQYIVSGLLVSAIALANDGKLTTLLGQLQACADEGSQKNPATFGYIPTQQEKNAVRPQVLNAIQQLKVMTQAIEDVVLKKNETKKQEKSMGFFSKKEMSRLPSLRQDEEKLKQIRTQAYRAFVMQNPSLYFNLGDLTNQLDQAGSKIIGEAEEIMAERQSPQWRRELGTVEDAAEKMLSICRASETPNLPTPIMPQEEIMLEPEEEAPIFMKKPAEGEVTILPVFEQAEEVQVSAPVMEQAVPLTREQKIVQERKRVVAFRGRMTSRLSQEESFAGVTLDNLNELLNEIHKDFNDYSEQAFVEDPSITPRLLTELYNEAKKVCTGFATANVTLLKNPTSRANFEKIKDEHLDAMNSVLKSYAKKK